MYIWWFRGGVHFQFEPGIAPVLQRAGKLLDVLGDVHLDVPPAADVSCPSGSFDLGGFYDIFRDPATSNQYLSTTI